MFLESQEVEAVIRNKQYSQRHGGPYDRGAADSHYNRPFNPHFYVGDTATSPRVELACMTPEEITAYTAGYNYNERFGEKKQWY